MKEDNQEQGVSEKMCTIHNPIILGYLEWIRFTKERDKKGMKQTKCKVCKRWFYEDEF